MGNFAAELHDPPDEELLALVNELAEYVRAHDDDILDKVEEHYLRFSADEYWMKDCKVPSGLDRIRICKYVRSRTIVVRRDKKRKLTGTIYIDPQWDIEHAIYLHLVNGSLQFEEY
jgi:hypothetical protein